MLLVTHDLEEAISASDVVHVLGQGPRAAIRASHRIGIPRPRRVLEARGHPAFGPLLQLLWDELAAERPAEPSAEPAPESVAP